MRLLFDENLSPKLVAALALRFPGSQHVFEVCPPGTDDADIWAYAARTGLTIVSKDDDFRQRSFLHGGPPHVIWLAVGNSCTCQVADLIRTHDADIRRFIGNPEESLLILRPPH